MTRLRILLLFAAVLILLAAVWVVCVRRRPVDMAQFAPANSLIYLEANEPAEILTALAQTDVWRLFSASGNAPQSSVFAGRWQSFVRQTSLGPIDSVIISRSQIAIVVTDLGATESNDTLRVKPEAALIVETHTSERRIRAPLERFLERFVIATYTTPQMERSLVDDVNFVEWRERNGPGQLVAAFIGSVVIVGNSRRVVDTCVAVARGRAPSLTSDSDLQRARVSHDAASALVFGYVPSQQASKLVSLGMPLLLGHAPTDRQFQALFQNAASKIIGRLTWTSRPFRGGIEDRYEIELDRDLVKELNPRFGSPKVASDTQLVTDFYSISQYHLEDPLAAWQVLRTSISRRVDTVAAVIFNTTFRTSLSSYGIEDPEDFLAAVKSPLNTVKLDPEGERQLLVATISDRAKLTKLFASRMRTVKRGTADPATTVLENADETLGVLLNDNLIVIGHPVDVQQYHRTAKQLPVGVNAQLTRLNQFAEPTNRAHVLTYTDDSERVKRCMTAIMRTYQRERRQLNTDMAALPYAVTQTVVTQEGLTRITRSPLGQFSAIIPLLIPENDPSER
ncbi:MAG TPA: hypothetical protein VIT88_15205 [Pyrinomonadaceae bacterium]